jgi:Ca-activated chloride channel family protein
MGSGRGGLGARSSRHLLGAHGKLNELNGIHPGHDPLSTGDAFELPAPNGWTMAERDPLSTFAVDVDTASYTHVRRQLRDGHVVEPQAVRVEEMVNYFRYDYPAPTQDDFAVHLEAAQSPFEPGLKLLRVGLKAREPAEKDRKPIHLTFLVDVSGSMQGTDRLPLAKRSLRFLVDSLKPSDTVALCTYAGRVQRVLGPTPARERDRIHAGIEGLSAGGSTAMSSGLELAYSLAWESRVDGEESREVVLSDGDANVGRTAHGDMLESIAYYSDRGVTLSTIGFGVGNYKGSRMEQLANKGNGNAYYIDSFDEARRIFGEKIAGTLRVMARDTKVQVEFDPASVAKYRLVGYENRDVADEDFRNDKVDAGEVGLGHEVTAVYEVDLREPSPGWAKVRLRWKSEAGGPATERVFPLDPAQDRAEFSQVSKSFARAVAVAALGENLRKSPFAESWTLQAGKRIAEASLDKERPDELELLELYGIATAELAHR